MNKPTASTAADVIANEVGLCKEALRYQVSRLVAAYDRPAVSNKREIAILLQDSESKLKWTDDIGIMHRQIARNNAIFAVVE